MSMDNYRENDKQRRLINKKRAGIVLTETEVKEIIEGRKKLRADMKAQGAYTKREFELTASSLGFYFDKGRFLGLWLWLWHKGVIWGVLGAAIATLLAMYGFSIVTEMRGHFTINLADELVNQGFELSNTADFANPTARIYGTPVEDAPCISIADLPDNLDAIDGSHNGRNYFAHTFYLSKRGEGTVDYAFELSVNSESLNASDAIWVMLFEDSVPTIFAKANKETGEAECLPAKDNDRVGYVKIPFAEDGLGSEQFEVVRETPTRKYFRLIPKRFKDSKVVTDSIVADVAQDEVHKYTVVIWLEGDDPDCTDDIIGGHIGMQMDFELLDISE